MLVKLWNKDGSCAGILECEEYWYTKFGGKYESFGFKSNGLQRFGFDLDLSKLDHTENIAME